MRLKENPRGLLLYRDELSGFFQGMGQYKNGRGDDLPKWLEMYGARPLRTDRKSADKPFNFVPRAAVSIIGSIQPDVISKCMGDMERASGFMARFMLVCPPIQPRRWSNVDIDADEDEPIREIIETLLELEFVPDRNNMPQPRILTLASGAENIFEDFVNEHGEAVIDQPTSDLQAAFCKLEGGAARLALVLHLVRQAAHGEPLDTPVSLMKLEDAMTRRDKG